MANRWPIASGNWSVAAIWSGSIKPVAGDDVFANSQSIYIDENITVATLRNSAITGVTQGGIFYVNDGITINLTSNPAMYHTGPSVFAVTNTPLVIISGSNSATITGSLGSTTFGPKIHLQDNSILRISGSVLSTTNTANIGIRHSSTGNLIITGSISGNNGGSSYGIYIDGSGSLFISGSVTAGVSNAVGVYNLTSTGQIVITGSVIGAAGAAHGIYNGQAATIRILGNVQGGAGGSAYGIFNVTTGSVYVIGNVIGGTLANDHGIYNNSFGLVQITGSVRGGVSSGVGINNISIGTILVSGSVSANVSSGITSTTNGFITINGTISSSNASNGVSSTGTGATNIFTGPFYNTGSFNAVYAYRMQIIEPASTTWRFDTEVAGGSKTLYTSNQLPGVPRQNDVRKGTQYNFGLTGSLEMPDPSVVQAGVTVGNTTGSAVFTAQDMFDVLTQDIVTTGSIGETLKNASSVQTVGATISAFKV
jgi:hypothetical protein